MFDWESMGDTEAGAGSVQDGGTSNPNPGKEYLFDGEDETDYPAFKKWVEAKIAMNPKAPKTTIGPMIYSLLRGEARKVVDDTTIEELRVENGEKKVWDMLEEAFPQEENVDKKFDAFDAILDTTPETGEDSTRRYTGKMRTIFKKGEKHNVKFDEDIRSMILMRSLGVSKDQRGSVLSHTQGKLEEKSVATALKQLYPDGVKGGHTLAYPHKKKKDKKLTDHQKAHKIYAAANEGVDDGWQYTTDQSGTFAASYNPNFAGYWTGSSSSSSSTSRSVV